MIEPKAKLFNLFAQRQNLRAGLVRGTLNTIRANIHILNLALYSREPPLYVIKTLLYCDLQLVDMR